MYKTNANKKIFFGIPKLFSIKVNGLNVKF